MTRKFGSWVWASAILFALGAGGCAETDDGSGNTSLGDGDGDGSGDGDGDGDGDGAGDGDGDGAGDGDGDGDGAGDGDGDGDGTGDGDGDGDGDEASYCTQGCVTADDCDFGSLPYDSDNYTCESGGCVYSGCNTDDECASLQPGYVCRVAPGFEIATCVQGCGNASDCDLGSLPYDSDNYTCEDGGCQYSGCNSDTECETLGNFLCADIGVGVDYCAAACNIAADCDLGTPPYDADNYSCDEGVCIYSGCNSDEECAAQTPGYVCHG